jgi:hypothetical protein
MYDGLSVHVIYNRQGQKERLNSLCRRVLVFPSYEDVAPSVPCPVKNHHHWLRRGLVTIGAHAALNRPVAGCECLSCLARE